MSNIFWGAGTAIEIALLVQLLHRRAWRWKSLISYCSLDLLATPILFAVRHNYTQKFYVYWSWFILSALIRLWMIEDVLHSIPGAAFLMPWLRKFIYIAGCVMTISCWFVSSLDTRHVAHLSKAAEALSNGVYLLWAAFVMALMVGMKLSMLFWSECGSRVALGMVLKSLCGILFVRFFGTLVGAHILQVASVTCLAVWLYASWSVDLQDPLALSFTALCREG